MKISHLMEKLGQVIENHGDVEVRFDCISWGPVPITEIVFDEKTQDNCAYLEPVPAITFKCDIAEIAK